MPGTQCTESLAFACSEPGAHCIYAGVKSFRFYYTFLITCSEHTKVADLHFSAFPKPRSKYWHYKCHLTHLGALAKHQQHEQFSFFILDHLQSIWETVSPPGNVLLMVLSFFSPQPLPHLFHLQTQPLNPLRVFCGTNLSRFLQRCQDFPSPLHQDLARGSMLPPPPLPSHAGFWLVVTRQLQPPLIVAKVLPHLTLSSITDGFFMGAGKRSQL